MQTSQERQAVLPDKNDFRAGDTNWEVNRPEDRIERQEVPLRHDAGWCYQRISRDIVVRVTKRVWHVEDEHGKDEEEYACTKRVLNRVERVERDLVSA